MVEVNLWAGLRRLTDGALVVTVEAATVGQMLDALVRAHPALEPELKGSVTIALDGEVITGGRNTPVRPDSEVYLLQRLKGG
ncbi:MAG: MoaD/ThiS family protein [Paracoccaceae bacterium]